MQASVLALNRYYAAIHVISARRAFCLLCKELAEVISVENGSYLSYDFGGWLEYCELKAELGERSHWDDWVSSVNFRVQVPRVIRLLQYDRIPRDVVKFNRRNIFLRDEHRCQYCGKQFGMQHLSLDHVYPRSRGGENSWENVVCACRRCNVRKGGRTPQEAGMTLRRQPVKPPRNPVLAQQLANERYEAWRSFLN